MCVLYVFCALLCIASQVSANASQDDYIAYIDSGLNDEFDWHLLKTSLQYDKKNVILSPISLKIVLALLYEGAAGITESELQSVMHFNQNKTIARQEFTKILSELLNQNNLSCTNQKASVNDEYTLNVGTGIFLDSELQPQQSFRSKACEMYQTQIESTNFAEPERASALINSWVNQLTNGKINKLVKADEIRSSVLLIINAIYFKGFWTNPFPKNLTHTGGFYISPTNVAQVTYMSNTDRYFYLESKSLDAKILRLPYKGRKFAMIIVLPNTKAGLPDLIQRLNVQTLKKNIDIMDMVTVDVILPKFKFDFETRLSSTLKNMGLLSMFQNTASLPGIVRGNEYKLTVTDVLQKSGIEVNEEGSEAFAATNVQIGNKFGESKSLFNATHPFLFFIEDQKSHTILFIGKVENPLETESVPVPSRFGDVNTYVPEPINQNVVPATLSTVAPHAPSFQLNPTPLEPEQSIMKRFNYFDLELLREVASDENVFISPASIKAVLGMILEGARGASAEEISKALRLPKDPNTSRNQLQPLLYDLSDKSENSVLESANGIFVSDKLNVYGGYRQIIQEYYKGFIKSVDFSNAAQAANSINNWINNSTRGLIPRIIGPENLIASSGLVITNGVYFKGLWKKAFEEQATNVRCFELPSRQCRMVHMMHTTDYMNYKFVDDIDAHALEIPYSDDKFAMLVLLPRVKNNIHTLMKDLQHASFGIILDKLEMTEVSLHLPRFEIEYSGDMVPILKELRIREIFSDRANLSGITNDRYGIVQNIVHKTKIDVNEKGTVAAAATGAVVIPLMGATIPRIVADHPFAFFIYRKDTRNVLFEGIVNKPTEARVQRAYPFSQAHNYKPQNEFQHQEPIFNPRPLKG